jgi:endogenous inhibitor of DNA gyrase (YacG/DUF329 family)
MKCPQCGKDIEDPKLPSRPFCSDRCKLIDLGKWISGDYRIASVNTNEKDPEDPTTMNDPIEE